LKLYLWHNNKGDELVFCLNISGKMIQTNICPTPESCFAACLVSSHIYSMLVG